MAYGDQCMSYFMKISWFKSLEHFQAHWFDLVVTLGSYTSRKWQYFEEFRSTWLFLRAMSQKTLLSWISVSDMNWVKSLQHLYDNILTWQPFWVYFLSKWWICSIFSPRKWLPSPLLVRICFWVLGEAVPINPAKFQDWHFFPFLLAHSTASYISSSP